MFELGSTAMDSITEFSGVIIGRVEYLTGCTQYLIQPKATEKGKRPDAEWFDESRIVINVNILKVRLPGEKAKTTPADGPDRPAPTK